MLKELPDFCEILDTEYGKIVVNRFDTTQTPSYKHARRAMNHDELVKIRELMRGISGDAAYSIIDVGAHIGTWGVFFANEPKVQHIYAFEALPVYYRMLCVTQQFNPKMRVFHRVVSDAPGTMVVPSFDWSKPTNFGGIELGDRQCEWIGQERLSAQESVPAIALDQMLDQLSDARLLKIDVEGMETRVMHGARTLIERYRPVLFVEYLKSNHEELMDFFRQYGYRVEKWHTDFLCVPQ
jgi:FkbM family methyltransferase